MKSFSYDNTSFIRGSDFKIASTTDDMRLTKGIGRKEIWHCCDCGKELTDKEVAHWKEVTPICCNSYLCDCRGLPVDPPMCLECIRKIPTEPISTLIETPF